MLIGDDVTDRQVRRPASCVDANTECWSEVCVDQQGAADTQIPLCLCFCVWRPETLRLTKIFYVTSTQTAQWAPGFDLACSVQYEPWELMADSSELSPSRLSQRTEPPNFHTSSFSRHKDTKNVFELRENHKMFLTHLLSVSEEVSVPPPTCYCEVQSELSVSVCVCVCVCVYVCVCDYEVVYLKRSVVPSTPSVIVDLDPAPVGPETFVRLLQTAEHYRTTEPQNQRTREPQNHRTREPQNHRTRELYRTTEPQNQRTTEPQNHRTRSCCSSLVQFRAAY